MEPKEQIAIAKHHNRSNTLCNRQTNWPRTIYFIIRGQLYIYSIYKSSKVITLSKSLLYSLYLRPYVYYINFIFGRQRQKVSFAADFLTFGFNTLSNRGSHIFREQIATIKKVNGNIKSFG